MAWKVKTIPHHPSRRWYALHWGGETPLAYLADGRTMGKYKYRKDAEMRADELNMGYFAARAKRDHRYAVACTPAGWHVAIDGATIAEKLPDAIAAFQAAGKHLANARGRKHD